jgi:methylated-DNA-[protein]-cysteine S-methyltransferase
VGVAGVAAGPNGVIACTVRPTKAQARAELRARVPGRALREDAAATRDACDQITEYLDGRRKRFALTIDWTGAGTEFQRQVWRELTRVRWGETGSYGELAERVGRPGAARAIGNTMNANRHWLIVPCHRVITSSGGMGGYGGGEAVKRALLELEGAIEPLLF